MSTRTRNLVGPRIDKRCTFVVAFALCVLASGPAYAQLRIVNYNTAEGARSGIEIVLQSIGEEIRNGFAKPIDVLALQEQTSYLTTTLSIVNTLNGIYGAGTYALVQLDGGTSGSGRPGLIYNTTTIQLIDADAFGTVNSNAQARQTLRYQLRPVGYDSSADFYVYNSHYKSDTGSDNENRRFIEANSIRSNFSFGSNALGEGAHVIYTGDFNMYTAGEPAFQKLLEPGNGQAFDPLNLTQFDSNPGTKLNGEWHENSAIAYAHTQAPCATNCSLVGGGMDDRFDFQLMTGEFLDGEGLSYISGSYHAFGNNGSTYNDDINVGNSVNFIGVTSYTKTQILNALWSVSDHLPLVADYQLPAVLNAVADTPPATLNLGQVFNLNVTVHNAANVLQPIGADELDYSVTTSGAVLGSFFDQVDLASGAGNVHQLSLDTSTPGMKTGSIMVQTGSQGAANPMIEIQISYQVVLPGLIGDYNENGTVDAADYTVWRRMLGMQASLPNEDSLTTPGFVTPEDYDVWKSHFGETLAGSGSVAGSPNLAVPEPGAAAMLLAAAFARGIFRRP